MTPLKNESSVEMTRSDSATGGTPQIRVTPPMALQVTPTHPQNDPFCPGSGQFSPWCDPFTPNQPTSAQSTLSSAMSFLNIDSTPEQSAAVVPTNRSAAIRPIGSGSAAQSSLSNGYVGLPELAEGPAFTTSGDPASATTRFVRLGNIPEHWIENGTLESAILHCGFEAELAAPFHVTHGDTAGTIFVFFMFDDLRMAAMSKDAFSVVLSTVTFSFVDAYTFYALDSSNPRARAISPYDGQIMFIASLNLSLREFDLLAIYQQVRDFAMTFGEIRSFAYVDAKQFGPPHFRVEYYSLSAADRAAGLFDIKEDVRVSESISVTIKEFIPDGYQRYAHPASGNGVVIQDIAHQEPEYVDDYVFVPRSNGFPHGRRGQFSQQQQQQQSFRGGRGGRGRGGFRGNNRGFAPAREEPFDFWSTQPDSMVHRLDMSLHVQNQPQTVNLQKIDAGVDVRTTVMLRNIPNRTQFEDLKEWLDESSYGHYDFSYLRIDFSNNCNVGYAFVNFVRPEFIIEFVNARVGKPWKLFNSQKRCEVSYATIQGIDCLLAKFRNSVVMEEYNAFRPKLWYHVDSKDIPEGSLVGDEAPFPGPDNEQKRRRSRDNATTVGLFPPRHGRGPHGGNHRDGQYDRGTSFALREERLLEQQRQLRLEDRRVAGLLCEHDQSQYPVNFVQDTRLAHDNNGYAAVYSQHNNDYSQDARFGQQTNAPGFPGRVHNSRRRRYGGSNSSDETTHLGQNNESGNDAQQYDNRFGGRGNSFQGNARHSRR